MAKTTSRDVKNIFLQKGKLDITFLSLVLILLTFGLIMLFSASYASALEYENDSYEFIKSQSMFAGIGVIGMLIVSKINYKFWRIVSLPLFVATSFLLFLLLVMKPAFENTDVKRWFAIGSFSFQPSEIAKFALVIFLATIIASNQKKMNSWRFVPWLFAFVGGTSLLIVLEPHLSAAILVGAIGVVMIFVGGLNRWVAIAGVVFVVVCVVFVVVTQSTGFISYGADRIANWKDPWKDATDGGFQTVQSLMAIGSGGILGRGLGQSRQKYLWVPEPQNDFIFSIICEELGLIGAIAIIVLFALLVWRGFKIAMSSPDKYGSLLSIGLTFQVGLQATLNFWVVTNTIPNTGISLPFFSYGGTALMILLVEMGVVLSVSRASNIEKIN